MLLPFFHHLISQTWSTVSPFKSWMYLGLTGMKKRRDALKCTEWFIAYLDLEEHVHLVTVYSNTTLQSCKGRQLSMGQSHVQPAEPPGSPAARAAPSCHAAITAAHSATWINWLFFRVVLSIRKMWATLSRNRECYSSYCVLLAGMTTMRIKIPCFRDGFCKYTRQAMT